MTEKSKKTISIILNTILGIFLVFSVIVTIYATVGATSADGVPSLGKTVMLSIQTDSMEGKDGFDEGSLIFVKKISSSKKENLKVGDVITFRRDLDGDGKEELNTHRIIECLGDLGGYIQYQTKGDNEQNADPYRVKDEDIVAIWNGTEIKGLGTFLDFMTSPVGFACLIILPLAVFFIFEIVNIVKIVRKIKGKKTISAKDEEEIKRKAIEEYLKNNSENNDSKVE